MSAFRNAAGSIGLGIALTIALFLGSYGCAPASRKVTAKNERQASAVTVSQQPQRPQYRYSVVMGGVYSTEELARARRTDSVVRDHYADFGTNPEFKRVQNDLLVYVSYRKRDRVYWTRARHRVKQGETILTAGAKMARARCANQLSLTPQKPTEKEGEPAEDVLAAPEEPQLQPPSNLLRVPDVVDADQFVPGLSLPEKSGMVQTPTGGAVQSTVNALPPAGAMPMNGGMIVPGFAPRAAQDQPSATAPASTPAATGNTSDSPGGGSTGSTHPVDVPSYPALIPPYAAVPEPDLSRVMWPLLAGGLVFFGIRKNARTR